MEGQIYSPYLENHQLETIRQGKCLSRQKEWHHLNQGPQKRYFNINLGDTLNKIKVGEPIVSMHLSDFRTKGVTQLICVCKTSTVKAFNLEEQEVKI